MKRLVIEQLLPDMVLVKPVTNANGLPIVAVGTILDTLMIERLDRLGITSVYVEGDAGGVGGKTLTELEAEEIMLASGLWKRVSAGPDPADFFR